MSGFSNRIRLSMSQSLMKGFFFHRDGHQLMFSEWHQKFKEKGLTALIGCGSSPGLANVIARESVDKLDACDTIGIYVYEGVWTE